MSEYIQAPTPRCHSAPKGSVAATARARSADMNAGRRAT